MTASIHTLYCFPCAGGSASAYYKWRRAAPVWLQIEPIELPGRGSRISDELNPSLSSLVEEITQELVDRRPSSYSLYGHSFGGLLAFECARRLSRVSAQMPSALLVSACAAPRIRERARFEKLTDEKPIIEEMRRLGGTPDGVFEHPELVKMI